MDLSSDAEEWYAMAGKLKEIKSELSVYVGSPLVDKAIGDFRENLNFPWTNSLNLRYTLDLK